MTTEDTPYKSFKSLDDISQIVGKSPSAKKLNLYLKILKLCPLSFQIKFFQRLRRSHPPKRILERNSIHRIVAQDVSAIWVNKEMSHNGVLVYVHGGGHVSGPFSTSWDYITVLARRSQMAGLLIDYRLSPKRTYPQALEDILSTIIFLIKRKEIELDRWALVGDGSGGGLAMVAARKLLFEKIIYQPNCMILNSPWVNLKLDNAQSDAYSSKDAFLTKKLVSKCTFLYAGETSHKIEELSPGVYSPEYLPPLVMTAGAKEMMLTDIRDFKDWLINTETDLIYIEEQEAIHTFPSIVESEASKRAMDQKIKFLHSRLGQPDPTPRDEQTILIKNKPEDGKGNLSQST